MTTADRITRRIRTLEKQADASIRNTVPRVMWFIWAHKDDDLRPWAKRLAALKRKVGLDGHPQVPAQV